MRKPALYAALGIFAAGIATGALAAGRPRQKSSVAARLREVVRSATSLLLSEQAALIGELGDSEVGAPPAPIDLPSTPGEQAPLTAAGR
jgi:hypothetical protein